MNNKYYHYIILNHIKVNIRIISRCELQKFINLEIDCTKNV